MTSIPGIGTSTRIPTRRPSSHSICAGAHLRAAVRGPFSYGVPSDHFWRRIAAVAMFVASIWATASTLCSSGSP